MNSNDLVFQGGLMTWGMANPDRYADRDQSYADRGFHKIIESLVEDGVISILDGHPITFPDYLKGEDGYFYAVKKL